MLGFIVILFIVSIITIVLGAYGLDEAYMKDDDKINNTLKWIATGTIVGALAIMLWVVYNSAKTQQLFANYVAQLVGIFAFALGAVSLIAAEETPESKFVTNGLMTLSWITMITGVLGFFVAVIGFYAYSAKGIANDAMKLFQRTVKE